MSKERYNQIIDEVYTNYINKCREELDRFMEQNPDVLVDYQEDTKEIFMKSIKNNKHWFTGEENFSQKWGLKIEERELSLEERSIIAKSNHNEVSQNIKMFTGIDEDHTLHKNLDDKNIPSKIIILTYNNETIEVYE